MPGPATHTHPEHLEDVATEGRTLSHVRFYDAAAWLLTFGREGRLRRRTVQLAGVQPGEAVLEVGCGTGSLAIAARQAVGREGRVVGIDPSAAMVAAARKKAAQKHADVSFEPAAGEKLPFAEGEFDAVLCSLVLHHLPGGVKEATLAEVLRVLRPGGRFLAVDLGGGGHGHSIANHLFAGHGQRAAHGGGDNVALLESAGFEHVTGGAVGISGLRWWRGTKPGS